MDILSLRSVEEARAELLDKVEAINEVAKTENRDPTAEEKTQVDKLFREHEAMQADVDRAEKYEKAIRAKAERRQGTPEPLLGGDPEDGRKRIPAVAAGPPPRNFKGENARQDAYDAGMWLKATIGGDGEAKLYCEENGLDIRLDAHTVDDDSRGGYLVPSPLANAIIAVLNEVGIANRLADVVPMASETLDMPKRLSGLTVYAPGEEEAITTSEMGLGNVQLATTDRAVLSRISRKLLRSSVVSVADRVSDEVGYAFADQRDKEIILGDGTATYFGETGLLPGIGNAGKQLASGTGWGGIVLADITGLMGILPSRFSRDRKFVCSSEFYYTVMVKLLATAGGVTMAELAGGDGDASFLGKPVYFTDKMQTVSANAQVPLLYGDFYNTVMIGDRENIAIATSDQRFFEFNQIAIRGTVSYDINAHELGDGSNAGGVVGLLTGGS
ncbi:MAG: phage major capsid protein [Planctomycetota bacterium]